VTMLDELAQQGAAIRRMVDVNRAAWDALRGLADNVSYAMIGARGTSDNAARYAQYVWGGRNRLAVGLAAPSLFGPYASPPSLRNALVVGISQSGQSPDLLEVMGEGSRQGRPTLAITNDPTSPLAESADTVIDLAAGPERAVAATKTYSAQLAAVAACSLAFAGRDTSELTDLPLGEALEAASAAVEPASVLASSERCIVLGRGFHHATAFEWALKLQELTYLLAQPFSAADFLHGPVAVVERGIPVLMVATTGPTFEEMASLATRLRRAGAHVVVITDGEGVEADRTIRIPQVEPWLSPIVAAPAIQRFSHALAVARRLDPDAPRGLTKVTKTR